MTPSHAPLAADGFPVLGAEHVALIALFTVGCVGFGVLGRRLRSRGAEPSFRRGLAVAIVAFTVPMQVLQLLPGDFRLGTSLPLQVCDLAWVVAAYALWTRSTRATWVLYFWGLTLVPQAILTPALVERFPDPRYLMFWGMHFLTVWAAVYLTFGLGTRPTWRAWRFAVACTLAWAGSVMLLNAAIGTNYGYLNRKPGVGSLLDVLGPWPSYVVVEVAVVALVWAAMTWPWVRAAAATDRRDDRGSVVARSRPPAAPSPRVRRAAGSAGRPPA